MSFDEDNSPFGAGVPSDVYQTSIREPVSLEVPEDVNPEAVQPNTSIENESPVNTPPNGPPLADWSSGISIIEAGKSTEGASRGYIAYTIKLGENTVRRRYSEFESLRSILSQIFPLLLIPPIPGKSFNLKLLATPPPNGVDTETKLVEQRKKMLQLFLKECLKMEQVRDTQVFHRFLDPNSNFNEDLRTGEITDLPLNPLCSNPFNGLDTYKNILYSYLPPEVHTTSMDLESLHLQQEDNTKQTSLYEYISLYTHIISSADLSFSHDFDKANKKVSTTARKLTDYYTQCGNSFNSFSLSEPGTELSLLLERIGTSYDQVYLIEEGFIEFIEKRFNDYWKFYLQCFGTIRDVLAFRELKGRQCEYIRSSLASKETAWQAFQKSDDESQRLTQAIRKSEGVASKHRLLLEPSLDVRFVPITVPNPPSKKKGAFSYSLSAFSKLKSTIADVITLQPELSREEQTAQLQTQINVLRQCLILAESDISKMDEFINEQFHLYHDEKLVFMRGLLREYCRHLVEVNEKCAEVWLETKAEIEGLGL
ncbi:hypothetical protein BABINDRAFT_7388 [Babjeviella inositovora NRRL Y-12698]|uniref:PX domain-containing protein n=1 Tax=Babjeviella inositovora NRRL Y-12698 TaxID=984486 RepID=A0A1E3QSL7_9ASCO|nr:uncharacterized protein BABINDRAFT_7388 [Babjeviella inositovora NRRL Y-12698]ODQ80681.1 hypothetical protein BABINDRAFT_7388 [Babjeviella inositovora NRRL Y-12698]